MADDSTLAISSSAALADLPAEAVDALTGAVRRRTLKAGDVLFEAGTPADGMVVVDRGRLGVTDTDDQIIATMGRGEVVGEMGALTGQPRSSTVIALRDTVIFELDQADFDRVFDASPIVGRALSRLVVGRLLAGDDGAEGRTVPTTVALAVVGGGDTDELVKALDARVHSAAIVGADLVVGRSDAEILSHLETLEHENELVIMVAGNVERRDEWFDRCLRQADTILVVVTEPTRAVPADVVATAERLGRLRSIVELVVVNPASAGLGHDATRWIESLRPDRFHHVRTGDPASVARVARLVLGQGIGLVFSGGAAKGLAHLGAWRAIHELDIPIDAVAGVSLGSLLGAGVALDYAPTDLRDEVHDRLIAQRGLVDLTFPWVALLRGQAVSDRIQEVGRGRRFEQAWRNFVCTSCDLTSGDVVEHRSGLLWEAIRASVSIPGLLPPVRQGDRLLVDGAVRNNLPIANLRDGHPTPMRVIAIDVGKDSYLDAGETPGGGHISGWKLMLRRLHPRRSDPGVPSMSQMLMRVMELAGDGADAVAEDLVRPDMRSLGLSDFEQIDDFERVGYDATITALG